MPEDYNLNCILLSLDAVGGNLFLNLTLMDVMVISGFHIHANCTITITTRWKRVWQKMVMKESCSLAIHTLASGPTIGQHDFTAHARNVAKTTWRQFLITCPRWNGSSMHVVPGGLRRFRSLSEDRTKSTFIPRIDARISHTHFQIRPWTVTSILWILAIGFYARWRLKSTWPKKWLLIYKELHWWIVQDGFLTRKKESQKT